MRWLVHTGAIMIPGVCSNHRSQLRSAHRSIVDFRSSSPQSQIKFIQKICSSKSKSKQILKFQNFKTFFEDFKFVILSKSLEQPSRTDRECHLSRLPRHPLPLLALQSLWAATIGATSASEMSPFEIVSPVMWLQNQKTWTSNVSTVVAISSRPFETPIPMGTLRQGLGLVTI